MHHSLSPFAPSRRPDAHRLNPSSRPHQPSSWRASTPTWAPHTPSRPSTSTEAGLDRNFRRSDVGLANTSRRQRKGPRLQSRARRPLRDRVSSLSDLLERQGRRSTPDVTISVRSRDTTSSNTSNLGAYLRRFPRRRRLTSDRRCFSRDETCDRELCNYLGSRSTPLHFVSSALAVCESEPRASRSTGVLMLQHDSHGAPEGQQLTVRRRATPTISYSGRPSVSLGESLLLSSSMADESGSTLLSWEARIGCQFGGVWVAASARTAAGEIGCEVPASANGRTQVTVSDLHSLTPLPLDTRARAAMDAPNSGRMALTVREAMQVEMITPFAATPVARMNARGVDVFGRHLVPESSALRSLCSGLDVDPRWFVRSVGRLDERVRLRCWVALSSGAQATRRADRDSVSTPSRSRAVRATVRLLVCSLRCRCPRESLGRRRRRLARVTSSWSWAKTSWSRSCRRGAQRVRRWNAHRWFPQLSLGASCP